MIASEYGKAIVSDAAYPGVAEFAQVEIIVHFGLASFVAALLHPATEQELGLEPSGKGDVVGCPELPVKGQRQVFRFEFILIEMHIFLQRSEQILVGLPGAVILQRERTSVVSGKRV